MRIYTSATSRGNDAASWDLVLAHEVDSQLCTVDHALVHDVCADQVGLWGDSWETVSHGIITNVDGVSLVRALMVEDVDRATRICQ